MRGQRVQARFLGVLLAVADVPELQGVGHARLVPVRVRHGGVEGGAEGPDPGGAEGGRRGEGEGEHVPRPVQGRPKAEPVERKAVQGVLQRELVRFLRE